MPHIVFQRDIFLLLYHRVWPAKITPEITGTPRAYMLRVYVRVCGCVCVCVCVSLIGRHMHIRYCWVVYCHSRPRPPHRQHFPAHNYRYNEQYCTEPPPSGVYSQRLLVERHMRRKKEGFVKQVGIRKACRKWRVLRWRRKVSLIDVKFGREAYKTRWGLHVSDYLISRI